MQQAQLRSMTNEELDQLAINTIRTLSIDAVQQANSGHPGTPMALAPLVYTIWNEVLRFDPQNPIWPNRDRFVLSNGHASMLLWSFVERRHQQRVVVEIDADGERAFHSIEHHVEVVVGASAICRAAPPLGALALT